MQTKKKRWPLITAIIAVVVVLAAVGLYFAYPAIKREAAPAAGAADILKAETDRVRQSCETKLTSLENDGSMGAMDFVGTLTLDDLSRGTTDYKSYLKADKVKYDIHSDMSDGVVSGILGISENENSPAVNIRFYKDAQYIYFSVPELTSQTFKISMDSIIKNVLSEGESYLKNDTSVSTDYSEILNNQNVYNYIVKILSGKFDKGNIKSYAEALKVFSPYIFSSINEMWENSDYEKGQDITVSAGNGRKTQDARTYTVTISNNAVNKLVESAINSIYADSKLTSYTSLITSVTKLSKDTLILGIEKGLKDVDNITFNITVDDNDRLIGIWVDLSAITGNASDCINIMMSGNNEPADYTTYILSLGDSASSSSFGIRMESDNETKGSAADIKAADFNGAIDILNMSNSQLVQISRDVMIHADILKSILTDKAISELM